MYSFNLRSRPLLLEALSPLTRLTTFLADFVVIYFRSLAASGLEGLLGGSDVQLGSLEASV